MLYSGAYDTFAVERIVYGPRSADTILAEVERFQATRVFVLASGTLRRMSELVQRAETRLADRCVGVYDSVPAHTPRDAVLDAASAARQAGADLILTFGGGSVTDAGKLVRLALQHNIRRVDDFTPFVVRANPDGTRTAPVYEGPTIPQIAIPTTLSGGEFNLSAGCTDSRSALKEIYRHKTLVPRTIILDPLVTAPTPQWLWLSTGVRALDHAIETVCSSKADPRSYLDSLRAIELLSKALPNTLRDPGDLGARMDAAIAVWSAMEHNRFAIPMGASHGIGHVLGGTCNVPHGYTSCVLLPAVLHYNAPVNEDRQALVSAAMGRPGVPASQVVGEFITGLGMPRSLSAVGVGPEKYETIARAALLDHYVYTNPRPLRTVADVLEILHQVA